jgi:PAS domain S-box-containing protein
MDSKNASYEELQHRVAELENLLATKQSAAAVPSSKQIYHEMFECLEMAIIVQDADTGEFLDVNNGFCSMFGYSRAKALDGLLETIIYDTPPFSKKDLLGRLDQVNRDGPQTFEWLSRKKNGDKFWTQVQLKHFRVDGKKCILAVIEDIHEQKILRENLQKSKDNVREILDKLDAMVFIHDTVTFELIDVNSQVTSRLGITYQDAVGGTIEDLSDGAPPYSQKQVVEWVRKARDEGPQIFDWFYKRKDGTRFWGEVHLKKATIGNDERIIAIAHDITEKKRIQEALEKRITALTRPLDDTGEIAFEDLFNLEDIQRLQDEFAAATGVASLITRTDGTPITQPSFFTRMCGSFIRQTEKGRKKCEKSDAALGKLCQDGPIVRNCLSCGFRGAGAGISVGGRHIANWLIGQVRDESQTEEQIRRYAREIEAEEEEFVRAFYEVPTMDPVEFDRISKVLFTLANQLSHIA